MKINWEVEYTKNFLLEKGFEEVYTLGSISYTCHVFVSKKNGKRIEIWDDKSGELLVVDVNLRSVNLNEL